MTDTVSGLQSRNCEEGESDMGFKESLILIPGCIVIYSRARLFF